MSRQTPLTRAQLVTFLAFGVAGWLTAALLLRSLGPLGIYQGGPRALTYVLVVPGTVPFVWLAGRLAKARPGQLFTGFSLSTAMATLCDGLALWFIPNLYGPGSNVHAGAGGVILWGVGVGVFLAYVMDRRAAPIVTR